MLRKLNCFFKHRYWFIHTGIFIGAGIYKFWHFKTYPNLYAMQSAPWYTELLLYGSVVAVVVVVCVILKLIIWKNVKVINFSLPGRQTSKEQKAALGQNCTQKQIFVFERINQ